KCCCKTELQRCVQPADLFDLIQPVVELFAGHMYALLGELLDKTLQLVQLGGVHAGIIKGERVSKCLVPVKAGVDDRHKPDAGGARDTELLGERVHRASYPPCPGPAGEEHQPDSSDQSSLHRNACLGDRLVFDMSGIVM